MSIRNWFCCLGGTQHWLLHRLIIYIGTERIIFGCPIWITRSESFNNFAPAICSYPNHPKIRYPRNRRYPNHPMIRFSIGSYVYWSLLHPSHSYPNAQSKLPLWYRLVKHVPHSKKGLITSSLTFCIVGYASFLNRMSTINRIYPRFALRVCN